MRKKLEKLQFAIFSFLSILISFLCWIVAKNQMETGRFIFNQIGYFGPTIAVIILLFFNNKGKTKFRLNSLLPFLVVFIFIILFAVIYSENYYNNGIHDLLLNNSIVSIILIFIVGYFIYQFVKNKGYSELDQFVKIPKTGIIWYILAIAIYPLLKFLGLILSVKLFPNNYTMIDVNFMVLIPLFLFSVIFFAGIGEEVGWRGYALYKLQKRYNPFVATLFIALVWSIWHIGYFTMVENYSVQQIPSVIIWTIMASFFATWFFNKTKGNVLVVIFFHASVNFAILFVPHPFIVFLIHLLLTIFVLITGKFFRKIAE